MALQECNACAPLGKGRIPGSRNTEPTARNHQDQHSLERYRGVRTEDDLCSRTRQPRYPQEKRIPGYETSKYSIEVCPRPFFVALLEFWRASRPWITTRKTQARMLKRVVHPQIRRVIQCRY